MVGKIVAAGAAGAVVVTVILAYATGVLTVGSFLIGVLAGGTSFGIVTLRVNVLTGVIRGRRRVILTVLQWIYYLVLIAGLYHFVTYWRGDVLWIIIGYTYVLIVFGLGMAVAGTTQVHSRASR